MDETMGNQQERSSYEKGWLAGIIDGEGHITLARQPYRSKHHYRPMICIANTNYGIIEKIVEIAKNNYLPVYVFSPKPAPKSKRKIWRVQINGLKRTKIWADYLTGQLVGKKEPLNILSRYIDYRLSIPMNTISGSINVSEKDEAFKKEMMEANHKYKGEILNDYTLETNK
jgi:hypothetical protein